MEIFPKKEESLTFLRMNENLANEMQFVCVGREVNTTLWLLWLESRRHHQVPNKIYWGEKTQLAQK